MADIFLTTRWPQAIGLRNISPIHRIFGMTARRYFIITSVFNAYSKQIQAILTPNNLMKKVSTGNEKRRSDVCSMRRFHIGICRSAEFMVFTSKTTLPHLACMTAYNNPIKIMICTIFTQRKPRDWLSPPYTHPWHHSDMYA